MRAASAPKVIVSRFESSACFSERCLAISPIMAGKIRLGSSPICAVASSARIQSCAGVEPADRGSRADNWRWAVELAKPVTLLRPRLRKQQGTAAPMRQSWAAGRMGGEDAANDDRVGVAFDHLLDLAIDESDGVP